MANKNIQIQDLQGNNLFPKTLGSVVFNNSNENLGGVEAGAQVNKIEKIKLNGVELAINSKEVDIVLPAVVEYSIVKAETADEGMSATYQLAKDGVAFGTKINIAKDMVVSAGELKICAEAGKPVEGLAVGDPYIDLELANADGKHIYIPVKDLVDIYTQGTGIVVSGNQISIDDTVVVTHSELETELAKKQGNLSEDQLKAVNSGITDELVSKYNGYEAEIAGKQATLSQAQMNAVNSGITEEKRTGYDSHVANADIHVTAEQKTAWTGKQDAIADLETIRTGASLGATALQEHQDISGKADKATTLAGYGITDGLTFVELA